MHDLSLSVKIAREALKNLHQYPEHPGGRKGFSGQAWVDSRVVQSFPSRAPWIIRASPSSQRYCWRPYFFNKDIIVFSHSWRILLVSTRCIIFSPRRFLRLCLFCWMSTSAMLLASGPSIPPELKLHCRSLTSPGRQSRSLASAAASQDRGGRPPCCQAVAPPSWQGLRWLSAAARDGGGAFLSVLLG
jgi:hypothetical protein